MCPKFVDSHQNVGAKNFILYSEHCYFWASHPIWGEKHKHLLTWNNLYVFICLCTVRSSSLSLSVTCPKMMRAHSCTVFGASHPKLWSRTASVSTWNIQFRGFSPTLFPSPTLNFLCTVFIDLHTILGVRSPQNCALQGHGCLFARRLGLLTQPVGWEAPNCRRIISSTVCPFV